MKNQHRQRDRRNSLFSRSSARIISASVLVDWVSCAISGSASMERTCQYFDADLCELGQGSMLEFPSLRPALAMPLALLAVALPSFGELDGNEEGHPKLRESTQELDHERMSKELGRICGIPSYHGVSEPTGTSCASRPNEPRSPLAPAQSPHKRSCPLSTMMSPSASRCRSCSRSTDSQRRHSPLLRT